jgi:AraC-like DNA-binding protein
MNEKLIRMLAGSRIYRGWTKAFSTMTGVPLFLRPIEAALLQDAGPGRKKWRCAVLGQPNCGCKSCARGFETIAAGVSSSEDLIKCRCGCCGAAVPIRSGKDLVALLQAGPRSGSNLQPHKYGAALKLLGIFAEQLGGLGNQMIVQNQSGEPPVISRAKELISQHYGEDISSGWVAKQLHLSRFYFCTLFKRSTGVTVTEYLTRVRIERVKELLLNPNLRISEIAFQTGFQSLTHFNRVFLKLTGQSPTKYRAQSRQV